MTKLFWHIEGLNIENARIIAECLYVRDHITYGWLPKPKRAQIRKFLGGDWYSRDLIERLVSVKKDNIKAILLLLIFTGWDFDYLPHFYYAERNSGDLFRFRSKIKTSADVVLSYIDNEEIDPAAIPLDKKILEEEISNILAGYGYNGRDNLERAKRTFLYYTIFRENGSFEQIQDAMNMPPWVLLQPNS